MVNRATWMAGAFGVVALVVATAPAGCSSSARAPQLGSGGTATGGAGNAAATGNGAGGSTAAGGSGASGGSSAVGGNSSLGGSSAVGASGGSSAVGGNSSLGGSSAVGASGGSSPVGGDSSLGGSGAVGASGGSSPVGGSGASGGSSGATGGSSDGQGGTSQGSAGTGETLGGTGGDPVTSSGGSSQTSGGTAGASGTGGSAAAGAAGAGAGAGSYPDKGDGLAMTPPMGWNSWNYFQSDISEQMIQQVIDAMVSSGMRDAGYTYVNLDDTWMRAGRDTSGNLVPDPQKFPSGIAPLAEYAHARDLKLGIYGDRGTATCSDISESGSYDREEQDAQTWASWGIDYLKYDNCNVVSEEPAAIQADYERMSAALKATNRPMVFSLCAWGWKGEWMIAAGHLWRSTGDIADCWDNTCTLREDWQNGFTVILDANESMAQYAGPGHWNDPDMLEVGNGHMTNAEYVAHFSLWCIMAAPLIAGNDIRNMSAETRDILLNEEAIAVDQDPAGIQGTRIVDDGDLEVWMKPLGSRNGREKAVVLFNRSSASAAITVSFSDIGISGAATVRDLWAHSDLGEFSDSFSAEVESHGVVMVKIVQTGSG